MTEKWSKLADIQVKLQGVPSGMKCANVAVVDPSEFIGKGQGFLEIALEESETARRQLGEENLYLRKLVMTAVNEGQSILSQARRTTTNDAEEVIICSSCIEQRHSDGD